MTITDARNGKMYIIRMIKFPTLSVIAIIAIFFTITANSEETQTHKQQKAQAAIRHYEERKEEEQQFIKSMLDEREERIEKEIEKDSEETEKPKEHIIHKKDSTLKKDVHNRHHGG